jgi:hypothetical protein
MIRIIGTSVLVLLSAAIVIASWELKAWSNSIASNDVQSFIKVDETKLDKDLWEEYLGYQLDLDMITANIFEISLVSVPAGELPNLLGKFENLRYAQLHKLDIVASQADQIFNILAVVTLN